MANSSATGRFTPGTRRKKTGTRGCGRCFIRGARGLNFEQDNQKLNKIEVDKMKFGEAIEAAKNGEMVARKGWNGKGMWITYSPGSVVPAERVWAHRNKEYAEQTGGCASVLPCLTMKTATGEILMGWLASQSDMLSDDWEIVGPQITRRLY